MKTASDLTTDGYYKPLPHKLLRRLPKIIAYMSPDKIF